MKIIYFLSLLLAFNLTIAQTEKDFLVVGKYAIDKNSTWQKDSVFKKPFSPLFKNLNIGYNTNTSVWCLFKIKNLDSKVAKQAWLCFDNVHLDSLVLYDGNKKQILGDRTHFSGSFIDFHSFKITLNPNETRTFLVKIKKEISFFEFNYTLEGEQKLAKQSEEKIVLISFFLGFIFMLILFNVIFFFITKKKLYAYYILYSVLSAVYLIITSNFGKYFLFPEFLYFSEFRIYTASLWFISLTMFLSHFLNLKNKQFLKYRFIYFLNGFNIAIIVSTLLLLVLKKIDLLRVFWYFGYINFLIIIVLIVWATFVQLKIDRKSAIYLFLSFFPQMIWGVSIILKSFQISTVIIPVDWLVIVSLYEVFFFGYLLTKNYLETFQKNNQLMEEILIEKEKSIRVITQIQIRERRQIANIIHDNLGSKIASIMQFLELKNLEKTHESIQDLANDIRDISHQILPKSLDDGALFSSLQSQIESINAGLKYGNIAIYNYDFPENVNEAWVYDVYLISLEIINNSLKHGKSNHVIIEFFAYNDEYIFQFTDDGIGYDTKFTAKGFGLENIEKRILYYKGTFESNSSKNEGTIVQISLPRIS